MSKQSQKLKSNFTQVPNGVFKLLANPKMSGTPFTVLIYLLSYQNSDKGCFPGMARIARECHCSLSSVKRAIKLLRQEYVLDWDSGKAKHTSNRYFICLEAIDDLCTTAPADRKVYEAERAMTRAQSAVKQAQMAAEKFKAEKAPKGK